MQGDGMGVDGGEHLAVVEIGGDHGAAVGQPDTAAVGQAPVQVDPDQLGDIAGTGLGAHLGRGAGLGEAAGLQHDQPVGQGDRFQRVVGDEQPGAVEGGQVAAQVAADLGAGGRVQGGQRLVQQQQPRVADHGPGQRDPLGLAAGQGPGPGAGAGGQADPVQPARCPPARLRLGDPAGAQPEGDVLQGRQVREEQVVLEHEADRPLLGRHPGAGRGVLQDVAVEHDPAPVQGHEAGDGAQQGRLAGAVGAEQDHQLPGGHGQLDLQHQLSQGQPQTCL
jgi:hypothetical protein